MYFLLRRKCLYKTPSGTSLKIKYLVIHFYLKLFLFFPYITATNFFFFLMFYPSSMNQENRDLSQLKDKIKRRKKKRKKATPIMYQFNPIIPRTCLPFISQITQQKCHWRGNLFTLLLGTETWSRLWDWGKVCVVTAANNPAVEATSHTGQ